MDLCFLAFSYDSRKQILCYYMFRPLKHWRHGLWLICAWSAPHVRLVCAWSALKAPGGPFPL